MPLPSHPPTGWPRRVQHKGPSLLLRCGAPQHNHVRHQPANAHLALFSHTQGVLDCYHGLQQQLLAYQQQHYDRSTVSAAHKRRLLTHLPCPCPAVIRAPRYAARGGTSEERRLAMSGGVAQASDIDGTSPPASSVAACTETRTACPPPLRPRSQRARAKQTRPRSPSPFLCAAAARPARPVRRSAAPRRQLRRTHRAGERHSISITVASPDCQLTRPSVHRL